MNRIISRSFYPVNPVNPVKKIIPDKLSGVHHRDKMNFMWRREHLILRMWNTSAEPGKETFMKYIYRILLILALSISMKSGVESMENTGSDLMALLPDMVEGWNITEEDHIYDRENLYAYINGGAELYLSYGFKQVVNRMYSVPDQPDILLDIFDGKVRNLT